MLSELWWRRTECTDEVEWHQHNTDDLPRVLESLSECLACQSTTCIQVSMVAPELIPPAPEPELAESELAF